MKSEELLSYLEGNLSADEIAAEIAPHVAAMRKAKATRPSSIRIHIDGSGADITVRREHINRVCLDFLGGRLGELEVDYLMSCIELCDDFGCENDDVREAVFQLCDPEVSGPLGHDSVQRIRHEFLQVT